MKRAVATWTLYAGMALTMVGGAGWPPSFNAVLLVGVVVLIAGVVLLRRAGAAGAEGEGESASGTITAARDKIPALVTAIEGLIERAEGARLEDVATEAEGAIRAYIDPVSSAQEEWTRRYGFARYAAMMSPLSTCERWLYRAWSAASDGHRDEALRSLREALPYAKEAAAAEPT